MKSNDITYIKELIASFYEGTTSPEEEKWLYDYFSQAEVADELKNEQGIFLKFYSIQIECPVPARLESKLSGLINRLEEDEKATRVAKSKTLNWKWVSGIAASIVLMVSVWVYNYTDNDYKLMADTYSDPETAYIETQKALLLVSNKLNKGLEQIGSAQKNLEKTNKIIEKNIQL